MDLDADVFFHSRAALSGKLCAIVEVVLVKRSEEGVVEAEYSAGWAQVHLQMSSHQGQLNSSPTRGGASLPQSPSKRGGSASASGSLHVGHQGPTCSVPVFVGSPRYLMLKKVFPEEAYPPQQLMADGAECCLHYTVRGLGLQRYAFDRHVLKGERKGGAP